MNRKEPTIQDLLDNINNLLPAQSPTDLKTVTPCFLGDVRSVLKEAQKLAQAQNDGRLVVLPCKVGDTVYCDWANDGNIQELTVVSIEQNNKLEWVVRLYGGYCVWLDWFGKVVFLTREEAEKALKEREAK